MKRFFFADFFGVMNTVIDGVERKLEVTVDEKFKAFLAEFFTEALAGTLVDWFRDRKVRNREETLQYISLIFRESLPNILMAKSLEQANK